MAKLRTRKHHPSDISRNPLSKIDKKEDKSVRLDKSQERRQKLSIHSETSLSKDKFSQDSEKYQIGKPSLIDLNINMSSLNDTLKNIIETINQHAFLLNNISGKCQKKMDKTSFKTLYKGTYTKDLITSWQSLLSRENLKPQNEKL